MAEKRDRAVEVLEALAFYGYLTRAQMLKLDIYSDKVSLSATLRRLERMNYIAGTEPEQRYGSGRIPAVFTLTKHGAELLEIEQTAAPLRSAGRKPPLDVEHRTAIVDVQLALKAWADASPHQLASFTADFAPSGRPGRKATEIGPYIPDAIAVLDCVDGIKRPLIIEVYRGGVHGRADYLRKKLPKVLPQAISDAVAARCIASQPEAEWSAPRLLLVLETAKLRQSLLAEPILPEHDAWAAAYIKSADEIEDFEQGWWRLDGKRADLFAPKQ